MPGDAPKILVAVATFRRPQMLAALLRSVMQQAEANNADIVVVDNDPARSAHDVCRSVSSRVTYIHEARPGISAARNASLRIAWNYDAIVFVDDDEVVHDDWLQNLRSCAERYDADVVCGPVLCRYPPGLERHWLARAGFFVRPRMPTGRRVELPATNNTLVRTSILAQAPEVAFDEEFSMTGGSDNELFWRLRARGARMVWCDEAIVTETVLASRFSLKWVIRRSIRHGNVLARLRVRERSSTFTAFEGLARVVLGGVRMMAYLIKDRRLDARSVQLLLRGVGVVHAALGFRVQEYKR